MGKYSVGQTLDYQGELARLIENSKYDKPYYRVFGQVAALPSLT
jgi:hypothetical protein